MIAPRSLTSRSLRAGRSILAWLCAVYAAVWSGIVAQTLVHWWRFPETLPSLEESRTLLSTSAAMAVLGAIFGAPAGFAAIATIRHFHWPRPLADASFASLAAVSGAALFLAVAILMKSLSLSAADLLGQVRYSLEILLSMGLMLIVGGAVGGVVYWCVAGAPQPPYSAGER